MEPSPLLVHPIRREIDSSVTLWGLEPDDFIVLSLAGYIVASLTSGLSIRIGPINVTLFVSAAAIAAAFSLWLYSRRGKPRYYLRDLLRRAAEPDIWAVTPDLESRPILRGD